MCCFAICYLATTFLDDRETNYQFLINFSQKWVIKCCDIFSSGSTVSSAGLYPYQRTTYVTSLPFLICWMMRSTVYSVSPVDGLWFGLSVGLSDDFPLSTGCVPVVGALVTRSLTTVFGIPWSSKVTVFG